MSSGWIKLHRVLIDWEWYKTPNMVHFWIHCLMRANHENGRYQGIDIPAGSFLSGRLTLSAETGVSEQSIRTCITRLKSTSELTTKEMHKNTLFTINSWEKYQMEYNSNQQTNQHLTSNQPATNQQLTTNKNDKNDKNDKNVINTTPIPPEGFDSFWDSYPKKVDKSGAMRSWKKAVKPLDIEPLMRALAIQLDSDQWQKNGGQFIPNPTTWLNQRRWESVVEPPEDKNSWAYMEKQLLASFEADSISKHGLNPHTGLLEGLKHG